MAISNRPYAGEDDYARMRTMLIDCFRIAGPPDYATIGDLDWWRFTADDPSDIEAAQLWLDDDRVIAVAWPSGGQVDLLTHPDHEYLEPAMLAWSETARENARLAATDPLTLGAYANASDKHRQALFIDRGYIRQDDWLNYWFQTISELPDPSVAPGYRLRNVEGEHDIASRVSAHRDAFSPSRMTEEKHRRVMESPTYRMDLDIIATAPDDSVAAYCIAWYDAANRHAVFEPVGCHSAHRQRGLASAVIYEGLRRARALGAATASVVSDGTKPAPNRLYAAVGFEVIDRNERWTKEW